MRAPYSILGAGVILGFKQSDPNLGRRTKFSSPLQKPRSGGYFDRWHRTGSIFVAGGQVMPPAFPTLLDGKIESAGKPY
jgi:hypothetical protein